ncbi:glutamate-rich protein 4 isoform X1 [Notamacropus eugenii]|uniref:glutamate-rich protein 4 isoform X1 n=1 Tax=Notamacropus eugenii TaxID=9315 RepID=UPI003B66F234
MEAWGRLTRAGLAPPELGPPPRALRDPSGACTSPGAPPGALRAEDGLVWVWEQLVREMGRGRDGRGEMWNLRRMDIQLFDQLCTLGLEIQALREENEASLDEEGEGLGASQSGWLIPDFEITI